MEENVYSLLPEEFQSIVQEKYGAPKFRAMQIFEWLYKGQVSSFDDMRNLPKSLRQQLSEDYTFPTMKIVEIQESTDGTQKFLVQCPFDTNLIEIVLMKYKHGITACISTQIGCQMHCTFCASGKHGLTRNLSAGEMILEILTIQNHIHERISNIVLMGMGEPLDNYENTIKFLQLVHDPKGLNLGYRHITLSTCGIVPKIYDLAEINIPITLAISLHAPTDELRRTMLPSAKKYPLKDIIEACIYYQKQTTRRITFEYALLDGVNDSLLQAKQLIQLLKPIMSHVNLIPVNPVLKLNSQPSINRITAFHEYLTSHGLACTIRRQLGADIDAACGQLRNRRVEDLGYDSISHVDH